MVKRGMHDHSRRRHTKASEILCHLAVLPSRVDGVQQRQGALQLRR